jgi:hypothetical protein
MMVSAEETSSRMTCDIDQPPRNCLVLGVILIAKSEQPDSPPRRCNVGPSSSGITWMIPLRRALYIFSGHFVVFAIDNVTPSVGRQEMVVVVRLGQKTADHHF